MSYYKTIEGKKMDAQLIEKAISLTQGAGDGRISVQDAKILLGLVTDDNMITKIEIDTIDYLFKNFRWTSSAEEWFKIELKTWKAHKVPTRISLSDLSVKHFAGEDVLKRNPHAQTARLHALQAATTETSMDHDEIGLWIRLSDGTTVEVFSNFIELEDNFVQLRGGCMVPVKAIEKVEI